ncbi:TPA: hypothetical protein HA241_03255 [Candidatus Woesearchaeota archaeon]|nr:hypothetical protein [Candidatus Woesearchaeota archaeon]
MDIIADARTLALAEINKFGLPDPIHFEISAQKAIELATKLGADNLIVSVGIVLIDLKLGQASQQSNVPQHVAMSVDAAREFLCSYDLPKTSKEKILNCIEAHHKDVPFHCIEAEICANADCYRFIHPRGLFAYLTLLGRRNLSFAACLDQAEKKLDEKYSILSLELCKKELEPYYYTLKRYLNDARSL